MNRVAEVETGQRTRERINIGGLIIWPGKKVSTPAGSLCLWFRASLICLNNCPTRCNTKQSVYYSASSLYMFRVSTTPIISRQNCNYSLRYWSYFCAATSLQCGQGINRNSLRLLKRERYFVIRHLICSCWYINNCPTRCNTEQSLYFTAKSLYMFRVSTTPTIRSTLNCNYSLQYWSHSLCSCRVNLQNNK